MKSREERGYGTDHRRARAELLRAHIDGTPCPMCRQPMYLSQQLDADHSTPIQQGGTRADRLVHMTCNRSAGGRSGHHGMTVRAWPTS